MPGFFPRIRHRTNDSRLCSDRLRFYGQIMKPGAHQEMLAPDRDRCSNAMSRRVDKLARSLFGQKIPDDPDRKIALYQRGLRMCPQSPRAHAELADVYADLGDTREAIEEYRETLRYDPDYPGARERLSELQGQQAGRADSWERE